MTKAVEHRPQDSMSAIAIGSLAGILLACGLYVGVTGYRVLVDAAQPTTQVVPSPLLSPVRSPSLSPVPSTSLSPVSPAATGPANTGYPYQPVPTPYGSFPAGSAPTVTPTPSIGDGYNSGSTPARIEPPPEAPQSGDAPVDSDAYAIPPPTLPQP